jgi:tRNA 2-selenouridine synthase
MAIEKIDIEKFLQLSHDMPVLDVRSPGEFLHAHIPDSFSLPLFTDEQRKIIGTAYKQQSRQVAVNIGLDYFSERMKSIICETENIYADWQKPKDKRDFKFNNNPIIVYCWRGGMRSGAVVWLLNLYGFKVYTIKGGYKAFRNWALSQLEKEYTINILGGFTGSGKTLVLEDLKRKGKSVIDLEKLANHKGSAFGSINEKVQPSQEMFENLLAIEFYKMISYNEKNITSGEPYTKDFSEEIWLEDESRHIGSVGIPKQIWEQMRKSPLYFLEISFEERLNYLVATYGLFDKNDLHNGILKIQKRLGGLETKNAINYLLENKIKDCFSILLHYYDKFYKSSLHKRENIDSLLNKLSCTNVDIKNAQSLLGMRPAGLL